MGNCDCYGEQIGTPAEEFASRYQITLESLRRESTRSSTVLPLPKIDTQPSMVATSTIKVDAAPSIAEPTAPPLNDLVKKTMQELPDLQYDDVERGEYFKCQRFFQTQNIYEGETLQKGESVLPHGRGNLYYTDGSYFTGTFVNGKAQGRGRLISANGSYYEGTIRNNRMEGSGQYRDSRGTYEGMMLSGVPHGQGTFKTDKLTFKGRFNQGEKVYGTLIWGSSMQCTYTGHIKNDMFHGEGKLSSPVGAYEGKFINGLKDGFGIFTWTDGKKFQGNYKEQVKCGYGQYYESDGTPIYKGQWQADKPCGRGIEFKRNNSTNKLVLVKVECRPES